MESDYDIGLRVLCLPRGGNWLAHDRCASASLRLWYRASLARVTFAPVSHEVARYRLFLYAVARLPGWLVVAILRDFELKVAVLQFTVTDYFAEGI